MDRICRLLATFLLTSALIPMLARAESWGDIREKLKESVTSIKQDLSGHKSDQEDGEAAEPPDNQKEKPPGKEANATSPGAQQDGSLEITREIQKLLSARGFNTGGADGVAGKKTRDAICHYQASNDLDINPLPTLALRDHLKSRDGNNEPVDYKGIYQHECEIAHLNNINSIGAVAAHGYEGTLTTEDRMCETVVAPFEISSNFETLISGFANKFTDFFDKKKRHSYLDDARETAKKANWMPKDVELMYGRSIHESRTKHSGEKILNRENKRRYVRELYEQGDAELARVLGAIDEDYPYEFKLFIIDDRAVNAEAIPGGYLYVNAGVFSTDYADLVIAHELAHVLRRHTTKELQARLIDTVETVDDLQKLLSGDSKSTEAILEKVLLLQSAIAQYSKQQELQSDACAIQIAKRMHTEDLPRKIDGYIKDLEQDHIGINKTTSTHPAYPERKQRMVAVYNDSGPI